MAHAIFSSQIDRAETLEIHVSDDTERITSGTVDGLHLSANGISVSPNVRMANLDIRLDEISVDPLKAVVGNVKLQNPTEGTTEIVLEDRDIANVLRSQKILNILHDGSEIVEGVPTESIAIHAVECQLTEARELSVQMTYAIADRDEPIPIHLQTRLDFIEGCIPVLQVSGVKVSIA
ncbi:hypothetical protein CKA32_006160 [Geitlerinema sp. FC II]|nr:LmeA family phospholipid-binding protein [Geitlerinema sp. CS-897]PPT09348.1 hypothetical protein CKA32_006160 [Geitlerinema sp. FC II]